MAANPERLCFVTGRLAEPSLRAVLASLAPAAGFAAEVVVMRISVAALISAEWLIGKLSIPAGVDRVILPGLCRGNLEPLRSALGVPVERGPNDLRDLPEFFQHAKTETSDYGGHSIEILAEINHANRLSIEQTLAKAKSLVLAGADIIDLGSTPNESWDHLGDVVRELVALGHRVSIDSFNQQEVETAAAAGAELVLSVNSTNCRLAKDWGCRVVAIPDSPSADDWAENLNRTIEVLAADGVPFLVDPILEPIGFGFSRSLGRYLATRDRFPNAEILMGIGNLTELTAVDSAGVNALLIGFCQEIGATAVLTTDVANWCRSSVEEVAAARELMHYAVTNHSLPKNVDDRLLVLRDERLAVLGQEALLDLQRRITDPNFRLFAENGLLTALNADQIEQSTDAFELFDRLGDIEPSHAFYLGWELMKASLALQLGKRYTQDQSLRWGLLTCEEQSHREKRKERDEQTRNAK